MNPSECKDLRQNPALPMCRWLILLCSGLLQSLLQSSCTQAGRSVMGTVSGSTGPSSGAYTLKPHRRLLALKKKRQKKKILFSTCLPWLLWGRSLLVFFLFFFALFSIPFAFITTGTNSFTVSERLAIMLSVSCAHGGKKSRRKPTKDVKRLSVSVTQDRGGRGRWHRFIRLRLASFSLFLRWWERPVFVRMYIRPPRRLTDRFISLKVTVWVQRWKKSIILRAARREDPVCRSTFLHRGTWQASHWALVYILFEFKDKHNRLIILFFFI